MKVAILVGDTVFDHHGRPGVVVENNKEEEKIVVQRRGPVMEKARFRGFINGLPQKDREEYQEIIDEVNEHNKPGEKIQLLQEKIEELRHDPRKHIVTRYLEAQMGHIMNSEKLHPRHYVVDSTFLRD